MLTLLTLPCAFVGWAVVRNLPGRAARLSAALGPVLLVLIVGALCVGVVEILVAVHHDTDQRLWLIYPFIVWGPAMFLTSGFALGGVAAALIPGGPTRESEARNIARLRLELEALPPEPPPGFGRR